MSVQPSFYRNSRIDSFRGWGCLVIVILHGFSGYLHNQTSEFWDSFFTELGNNIISLFFCVSGYLIYLSLESLNKTSQRPLTTFYIRRAFRILPIWWILVTGLFLGGFFDFPVYLSQMFFYFGFLSYIPVYLPITPSWSLFVEENFYLLFPLFYQRLYRLRNVIALLIVTILTCLAWRSLADSWGVPTENYFISRSLLSKLPFFISGVFVLHLERFLKNRKMMAPQLQTILLSFLGIVSLLSLANDNFRYSLFFVPLLTFICLAPNNLFSWSEHSSFLKYAGQRCYGIYILHDPVMKLVGPKTKIIDRIVDPHSHLFLWFCVYTILILAITLIAAAISFRWIERPLIEYSYDFTNRYKKRFN